MTRRIRFAHPSVTLAHLCALATIALGGVVMVGWVLRDPWLVQVHPSLVPMQFNTALGLACAGGGLLLHLRGHRAAAAACSAVPIALGVTALLQYAGSWDFGIDRLFIDPFTTVHTQFAGRMSVNSAVTFSLTGAALLLGLGAPRQAALLGGALLSAAVVAVGLDALFGYLAGVDAAYGWTRHSQMAVHTAGGFILVGAGAFLAAWRASLDERGDSPAWVAIPIGVAGLLVTVALWQTLAHRESAQIRRIVATQAGGVARVISDLAEYRIRALERMAHRLERWPQMPEDTWARDALNYVAHQPGYVAIEVLDRWADVRWLVPRMTNEALMNSVAGRDATLRAAIAHAERSGLTTLTTAHELVPGGTGFYIFVPVPSLEGKPRMIAAVLRYRDLFAGTAVAVRVQGYAMALSEGGREIYAAYPEEMGNAAAWAQAAPIALPQVRWQVRVWPTDEQLARLTSAVPLVTLVLGVLASLALAAAVEYGRTAHVHGRALLAANARLTGEIAERKEAQVALEQAHTSLQAVNAELESFAYAVSHDLRQPLRSMAGFSRILQEDYAACLDEAGRDYLGRIQAGATRMGQLIDGLLRLSRITRSEVHRTELDLSALAREVAAQLQESDPARRVEWAIAEGLHGEADEALLRVLLQNLLGNAWKFTTHSDTPRIEVGTGPANGTAEFYVRDNGAGFDMAYADKLFGAFQRLHGADEYPGTGIGLATVQRIVHRHGGRIRAEGAVGAGATFRFTLRPMHEGT